jgi:hypothetical protein
MTRLDGVIEKERESELYEVVLTLQHAINPREYKTPTMVMNKRRGRDSFRLRNVPDAHKLEYTTWQRLSRKRNWLAQLGLERFDLRSQVLHLLRLRCNNLGLLCDQVLDG